MNLTPHEDFTLHRDELVRQIASQRGELAAAYRNLEKPIHYAEVGMKGLGFLRQNQWLFVAAPTVVSVGLTLFNAWRGKKAPKVVPVKGAVQPIPNLAEGSKKPLAVWVGRAYQLYQLYRKVRTFIP
jgi:hypothetical protein